MHIGGAYAYAAGASVLHLHQADATSNAYLHITQEDGGSAATDGMSIGVLDGGVNAVIRNRENGFLKFYTDNTERWVIESNGKFYGTGQIQGGTVLMGGSNINYSGDAYSPIGTNSTAARLGFFRDFSASYPTLLFDTADNAHFAPHDADMRIYMGSAGGDFGLNSSNNLRPVGTALYLNTGGGNYIFEQAGTARFTISSSGGSPSSDRKLKENIEDIQYGLDTIKQLRPRKFQWKGENVPAGEKDDIGFIAQEVESIIPEVVNENIHPDDPGDGSRNIKRLDYGHLTSVLVKAVQEQQIIIEDLKARINVLEG